MNKEGQGNRTKAFEINREIIEKHPDYLFGKLNLANEYILTEQYEKVPEILGKEMELKKLYRKEIQKILRNRMRGHLNS